MLFAKSTPQRYGIASNGTHFCAVCFQNNALQVQWFDNEQQLIAAIPPTAEIVYSISHQHIWRKVLFLAKQYHNKNLLPQIIQILKQELPLAIEEVYFDYHIQHLTNGIRLSLFALRKNFAVPLQSRQTIWDCELHCIARALLHLNQQSFENIELFYFPLKTQFFHFQNDGVHFCSTADPAKSLTAHLPEIPNEQQSLYLSALGASLWNGTESI